MPYLGNIPATQFAELKYQDFTGGTGTSFTLNDPVGTAQELEVFVNNVRQEPGVAYTVSGTTLTMTGSIVATDDFYVVFQGKSTGTATHPAGQALTATDGTFSGNLDVDGTTDLDGLTVAGNVSVDSGTIKLDGNYPTGTENVALGDTALDDGSLSGGKNTAIGHAAMTANTSGSNNVGVGRNALLVNTTGADNVAVGKNNMDANSTGSNNTALGSGALTSNTTASNNTALGYQAMAANTEGAQNVAVGQNAADAVTTGSSNVAVGAHALGQTTTASNNTAVGKDALTANTTGALNTATGSTALDACTTASYNAAFGYAALGGVTTGNDNNAFGVDAGKNITTGVANACFGRAAGQYITTGSKNTIIGGYNGNEGGLDIRTSSNNIVLSDGDGNPRVRVDGSGRLLWGTAVDNTVIATSGSTLSPGFRADLTHPIQGVANGNAVAMLNRSGSNGTCVSLRRQGAEVGTIGVTTSSTSFNTSSDHRLKENVTDLTGATTRLKQLNPVRFNFIADSDTTVDGFLAHEVQTVVPEAITGTHNEVDEDGNPVYQGIDQSKLVPLLVATIQELEARITALEAE